MAWLTYGTALNQLKSENLDTLGSLGAGLGIFGAGLSIVSSVASMFGGGKDKAEQYQYNNDLQLKQIEAVNKALQRQLEITKELYGPQRLEAYKNDLGDIQKLQEDAYKKLKGRLTLSGDKNVDELYITSFNKGEAGMPAYKAVVDMIKKNGIIKDLDGLQLEELLKLLNNGQLDEQTAAIVESLKELEEQFTATNQALFEEVTGFTYGALNDEIRQLAETGELTAGNIEKVLQKAINSGITKGFERRYIETAMQPFYDLMSALGKDGEFSDDDINALLDKKAEVAEQIAVQGKQLEKLLGDITTDTESGIQGSLKGMTQDQAGALEAIWRGVQLENLKQTGIFTGQHQTMRDQLAEMRNQTLTQIKIEENTRRNANSAESIDKKMTDVAVSLSDISRKMDSNKNVLDANGLGG